MKAAIMGYGTIGSGVAKVLSENAAIISRRAGEPIELKYVLDLRDFSGDPIQPLIVHDYKKIVYDPEIKLVVETMGGVEPAYTFVKAMLTHGKHVATSNKALVAAKGAELIQIAADNHVNFMFEASVGGGIPIIRPILKCTTGDVLEKVYGIVNGTTNYMLTKMAADGAAYDDVLKEAQEKGYAEKDPTADIEGHDPCRKIAILASLVTGGNVKFKQVPCEGISGIDTMDMEYARQLHCKIKLLGVCRHDQETGKVYVRTAPYLVRHGHPLYGVHDVFNGVLVRGNMVGDLMFYGSGAGKLPTASAVVSDVVECVQNAGHTINIGLSNSDADLFDPMDWEDRYFVRIRKQDLVRATELFGSEIRIVVNENAPEEFAFVTPLIAERDFEEKVKQIPSFMKSIRILKN